MNEDDHLDGNSLGALFIDVFGREMTDETGRCGHCGNVGALGALIAYRGGPGDVLRCPVCDSVLLVAVATPAGLRLTFEQLRWISIATEETSQPAR